VKHRPMALALRVSPWLAGLAALALAACGPNGQPGDDDGGDDDDGPSCANPAAESCTGGRDEDCDGLIDCEDTDCIEEESCANCGELEHPEASLALPDGEGNSYVSSLNFTGFSDGQALTDVSKLLGVCVNMEHSWLRDLQIELSCPSGTSIVLQMFLGQTGSEVFMGQPNDDDDVDPVPGVGAEYCWTPNAVNPPMLDYVNNSGFPGIHDLPAGDYRSVTPMSNLLNCPLNGRWTIKVTDLWAIDNGYIFSWGVKFDPSIVEDCANWPPIGRDCGESRLEASDLPVSTLRKD
jgi:subtilisin-like proprotein convertase family protein